MKRIPIIIFVLVVVASIYLFASMKQECGARGGVLVHGVGTYECAGGQP